MVEAIHPQMVTYDIVPFMMSNGEYLSPPEKGLWVCPESPRCSKHCDIVRSHMTSLAFVPVGITIVHLCGLSDSRLLFFIIGKEGRLARR
jgi:hypothetical protein